MAPDGTAGGIGDVAPQAVARHRGRHVSPWSVKPIGPTSIEWPIRSYRTLSHATLRHLPRRRSGTDHVRHAPGDGRPRDELLGLHLLRGDDDVHDREGLEANHRVQQGQGGDEQERARSGADQVQEDGQQPDHYLLIAGRPAVIGGTFGSPRLRGLLTASNRSAPADDGYSLRREDLIRAGAAGGP